MKKQKEYEHDHDNCAHDMKGGKMSYENKNIAVAIVINIFITVTEVVVGLLIGSLALVSDAAHNFSDVGSMALSWWGEKVKNKKSTVAKTFGYKRAEIIIALFNAMTLLAVVIFIFIEAIRRLSAPAEIAGSYMIWMAMIALVGNGLATYLLEKDSHKNLNMKSAWMHSMQDALFSLGVVIGAVLIYYFHWFIVDPIISILLSVYILKEIYGLIKEAVNILMESVPEDIDFEKVKSELKSLSGVIGVNDLHIWQTDSNSRFLSAHLEIENVENEQRNKLLFKAQELLDGEFKINHTTIQLMSATEKEKLKMKCEHCN